MATLVLSPDAVIRFKGGRAAVHNPYSPAAAIETDDTAVIAFIARFAVPQDPFEAMRSLPAATRPVAERLLGELVQAKVLVPADAAAEVAAPRGEVVNSLRILARAAALLSEDVLCLGLEQAGPPAVSGLGLSRRVSSLMAATDALREEVKQVRAAVQAEQLAAITARGLPLRLHIAHAAARIEAWVNLRSRPPSDLAFNAHWGLPLGDGAVQAIFAMDVFERLPLPEEARFFARECRRVLQPGGRLRLVAPAAAPPVALLKECGFRQAQASAYMAGPHAELNLERASGIAADAPRSYVDAEA